MASIVTTAGRIGLIDVGRDRSRTPILFLHGVGSDKSVWQPQLDHFGKTRRAIAADYSGYGESDFVEDAKREDFATAMIALLDALEIERAHVCGLSLGGIIAMLMADTTPERVASLVLADTFAEHPDGRAIHDGSVMAAREQGMAALAEARVDRLLGSAPPEGLKANLIETMSAIDVRAYELGARAVWLADVRQRLVDNRCPTLVLCGSEDRITPPTLSEALAEAISGAQMSMIDSAGHLSNAEAPEAFNSRVESFLSEMG